MNTRTAGVNIFINGKNCSMDLAGYLTSITYTDVLEGEADTAEIVLQDRNRLWTSDWFPKRGDTVNIELVRENWNEQSGVETLPLGSFEIDEIKNSYPPNVAHIKLNSIPNNSELRSVDKSASWEDTKLSNIAGDIATRAGLTLFYDTADDPIIKRAELSEQSSLSFLQKMCKKAGLALKVSDNKVIIFDEEKYEKQSPVMTLKYGESAIKSFSGTATISKIYTACHVKYGHSKKKETIEGSYQDASKSGGMTLEISQKVESQAEAERLAKKKLREKNKDEIKVQITAAGNFGYLAGNVLELVEFGFYSGRYIVEKATHKIAKGYEVTVELRRCLSGY